MLRIISIVFSFLVRLRFLSNLSKIQVIRNRYGNDKVKLVRQFEKLDYKGHKILLDLNFLENCIKNNVTPKFLQFRLANKDLRISSISIQCQQKLIKQEIINKKRRFKLVEKDLLSVKNELMFKLKWIGFHHVCNLFLTGNDKSISKHQDIQDKKFCKLSSFFREKLSHYPEKVIYNFSKHNLTEVEKFVLCKGLQFALPPTKLEYADYMVSFDSRFRYKTSTNLSNIQNATIKSKLRDTAFSSFTSFDKDKPKNNLTKAELHAANSLKQNNDIIIQKADKSNTVVIIDKDAYQAKMKSLISYPSKFKKLDIKNDKHLNFILDKERKLKDILKPLYDKGCLTKSQYLKICPSGSKPGILYGQAKVHKPVKDNSPSLRPILSAIGTPTYDLAKFLVLILKLLTKNEYTVHDSFSFANDVRKLSSKDLMAILDVESLFTNIPLAEIIDNIINDLYLSAEKVHNFEKHELKQLLMSAAFESFFVFDGEYYIQVDGVAM